MEHSKLKFEADNVKLLGFAVISLGNCWRLAGCNDMAIHINIAKHYSIYYTEHSSVCYVVQFYKSILICSIQLAWNLAMSFDERWMNSKSHLETKKSKKLIKN